MLSFMPGCSCSFRKSPAIASKALGALGFKVSGNSLIFLEVQYLGYRIEVLSSGVGEISGREVSEKRLAWRRNLEPAEEDTNFPDRISRQGL